MQEQDENQLPDWASFKLIGFRLGGQTVELPEDLRKLDRALLEALTLDQTCEACCSQNHQPLHKGATGLLNTLAWMISSQSNGEVLSGPRDGERIDRREGLARVYKALPAFADFTAHVFAVDGANEKYALDEHPCLRIVFGELAKFAESDETRRLLRRLAEE